MTTTTLWTWALAAMLAVTAPSLNAAEQQPPKELSAAMLSKTAHAISDANHRRAERQADERVRKDLEQFLAATAQNGARQDR